MSQLTNEQNYFLTAISGYINATSTPIPDDVNKTVLTKLSNSQQLSPILFYQTRLPDLFPAFVAASYYAENRRIQLETIDKAFKAGHLCKEDRTEKDAQIQYLIFKGPEVAQYYPHPYLRTFGDIDLLVHAEDKERAGKRLEALGFSCESKGSDHEWCYAKEGFAIELHHRLLYNDVFNEDALVAFTDTVWEHASSAEGCCYHLEPEFHFVYLLLHLRKHFLWAGVGIRPFLDLAIMTKHEKLDWNQVWRYIKTCDIERFASVSFAMINRWFGIEIPLPQSTLSDDFYFNATDKILSGSIFGDMSRENLINNDVFNSTNKHGKLLSTFAVIFPPFEQMKRKYPRMGKHKILLPILWIRRMIDALCHHTAIDGLSLAEKYLTAADEERMAEVKAWGIR